MHRQGRERVREAFVVLALIALFVTSAGAEPPPRVVTYSLGWARMPGAEACVGAGPLARAVAARLGHDVWTATSAADVLVEGYIEKRPDSIGWHAHVDLTDAKGAVLGQRDVMSDDDACEALERPLTLMLALIIDPKLLLSTDPSEPPAAPAPAPSPTEPPAPAPAPATRTEHRSAEIGAGVAVGLLPGVAPGIVLTQRYEVGTWSMELGGNFWFPRDAAAAPGQGATFSLVELAAAACPFARTRPSLSLRACAGIDGGVLAGEGFGVREVSSALRPVGFFGAAVGGTSRVAGPVWIGLKHAEHLENGLRGGGGQRNRVSRLTSQDGASLGAHGRYLFSGLGRALRTIQDPHRPRAD